MIYTLPIRDPEKAYRDTWLWLPKSRISVDVVKQSLIIPLQKRDGVEYKYLWKDAPHHLGVPRERIDMSTLDYPIVDLTPRSYEHVPFKSGVVLDMKRPEKTTQRNAFAAFSKSPAGILNLGCVAGDTVIGFNRGGKGFSMNIETAYRRLTGGRYAWNREIPTFVRAKKGEYIGLQEIETILYKGIQQTREFFLEDYKSIRVTDDHEMLTTRGWVQARDVTVGDKLITDSDRFEKVRKPKQVYRRLSWYSSHPYARRQDDKGRKDTRYVIEEHRAVAEAAMNGLTLQEYRQRCRAGETEGLKFVDPNKYHVHHLDEDFRNNHPSNLTIVPKEDHLKKHKPGYGAFGLGIPEPREVMVVSKGKFEPVYDIVCKDPHRNFVANGIVVHNCGKGKTVLALHLIAQKQVPALIINDQTHILKQWVLRILEHMEVPGDEQGIGWIQGHPSKWTWERPIVLASLTSLAKYASMVPPGLSRRYGIVIWDEIHHLPAASYCETADLFYGNRYGLTATTDRADGGEALYFWHVGGVIHKDLEQDIIPEVVFIRSPTTIDTNDPATWEAITSVTGEVHLGKLAIHLGTLEQELNFNRQMVDEGMRRDKITLYAATSKDHSRRLHEMYPDSGVLDGTVPIDSRLDVLTTHKTVFSTTKMAKEALDKETLDSLVILTEFSSENMLQQTVGRIQRFLRNKKSARVVVVWHVNIPPMAAMGNKLMGHFRKWGMKVRVI